MTGSPRFAVWPAGRKRRRAWDRSRQVRRHARIRNLVLHTGVGLAIGGLLVITFLRLVNVKAVYHHLLHFSIGFGLLCGVTFFCAYVVRAMRWRCLLRPVRVSIFRATAIYQVAIFVNWLLPVRGGELTMSLMLRQSNGVPVSRSLATVSMDKAMDLLPAIALLALLPFMDLHLSSVLWLLLLFALAVIAFAAGILAFAAWRRDRAVAVLTRPLSVLLPRRVRERVEPFTISFLETLLALIRRPGLLAIAGVYTAIAVLLDALTCLLAFMTVGVPVALPVVFFGYTFFNLAYILPTPPGQVGSNELVGLLIFSGLLGVNRSGVGAMFLFLHPWTALLMTCSGLACLSVMGLKLRSTLRLAQESPDRRAPNRADWQQGEQQTDWQAPQPELKDA